MKRLSILLVMATTAHAATWVTYARDDSMTIYDYEPRLITQHDNYGRTLVVWTRMSRPDGSGNTVKYELHCPSRSYRITHEVKNTSKEVVYQAIDRASKWIYAVPDTSQMALIAGTCGE